MKLFNFTSQIFSWAESLPAFFEDKSKEYETKARVLETQILVMSGVRTGFLWAGMQTSRDEDDRFELDKAVVKLKSIANRCASKVAKVFSYVIAPLTFCLLPPALVLDLAVLGINVLVNKFESLSAAENNIQPSSASRPSRRSGVNNVNNPASENTPPSMFNAFRTYLSPSYTTDNNNNVGNNSLRHRPF